MTFIGRCDKVMEVNLVLLTGGGQKLLDINVIMCTALDVVVCRFQKRREVVTGEGQETLSVFVRRLSHVEMRRTS